MHGSQNNFNTVVSKPVSVSSKFNLFLKDGPAIYCIFLDCYTLFGSIRERKFITVFFLRAFISEDKVKVKRKMKQTLI